jgi:plasmid stability protein
MKNITVSGDEKIHRRARIRAAELDKSLSAVVRDFLIEFSGGETDYDRRKNLQRKTLESIRSFRAKDRLKRDEIHDRDAIR